MGVGLESPTDMLDLVDIKPTEGQRGVVACALYRDGRRRRDIDVDVRRVDIQCEVGALRWRERRKRGGELLRGLLVESFDLLDRLGIEDRHTFDHLAFTSAKSGGHGQRHAGHDRAHERGVEREGARRHQPDDERRKGRNDEDEAQEGEAVPAR